MWSSQPDFWLHAADFLLYAADFRRLQAAFSGGGGGWAKLEAG
jgi:hypothetical protein